VIIMVQRTRYGGTFPYVAELGRPAVAEVSHVARRSAAKAGSQGPDRRAKLPEPAAVPFTALADWDIGTCFSSPLGPRACATTLVR
jgi:hypothetical protein